MINVQTADRHCESPLDWQAPSKGCFWLWIQPVVAGRNRPGAGIRFRYSSISRACEITSPSISLKGIFMTSPLTVSNLLGPWSGDDNTGLMQRCKEAWDTPLESLNDLMVATFLNQNIATEHLLVEARRRMKEQERDETEYFDGQLLEAIERVQSGG
ncbi:MULTISPECIES: hypothetical protein [unclassified Pseudomonas]|nr:MULTISPECIES: hypothetical protein [unclassified Pseudomonas]